MKKYIITLCIALLLLSSCASRKVNISKEDVLIKTDSVAIMKVDSISEVRNNIILTENSDELEIKPVIDSLPIIVNGISYKNVTLRYKKQNKVLVDTTIKKVSKIALKKVFKNKKETKKVKTKESNKEVNNFVYLWLLIIPIGIYIYRTIKNKIFL
jgi:uncharacterized protein YcfL